MAKRVEKLSTLKRRYPKQWLLLTHVVTDELTHPVQGKLVAHSKNRDEIYDRLSKMRGKLGVFYTGEIPRKLVVLFIGVS